MCRLRCPLSVGQVGCGPHDLSVAAAYTYDVLLEDYALSFCFWWTAVISLGGGTLPSFDKVEGARMKQLWGKGLFRAMSAMRDLDCLALIKQLAADIPDDLPAGASAAGTPRMEEMSLTTESNCLAEHSAAPDCLQRPRLRRSRFRQQVSLGVVLSH